jgi:septal ring factor EnvC (AmiA/AmiB activator)
MLAGGQVQVQYTLSKSELEAKRKQIVETIQQIEEQLETAKKNKKASISQLRALQAKLAERQRLIGNINDEIDQINNTIKQSTNEVGVLKQNLELLKIRYAQSIRYSYQNRSSYDMIAFIFSAENFNDAMRRIKYLKKYRDYRKEQVEQIRLTQGQIENKIGVLNNEKKEKDDLLTTQEQQKKVLQDETTQTDQLVNDLKGQEKQLMAEIEKNKKIAARVNKAINDIIKHEIEEERKKAAEEMRKRQEEERRRQLAMNNSSANTTSNTTTNNPNVKNNNSNIKVTTLPAPNNPATNNANTKTPAKAPVYDLSLTPEAAALSTNFEANKGKLPWPVEKGYIAEYFGKHPHPIEKKVMVENDGIEIRTTPGATARAVFDGVVTKVFYIDGAGWIVMINHGRYFTVYNGLSSTMVKKDDQVRAKQPIGIVGNDDKGDPTINFQVWREAVKVDPAAWIAH